MVLSKKVGRGKLLLSALGTTAFSCRLCAVRDRNAMRGALASTDPEALEWSASHCSKVNRPPETRG
jgi:hypothetical protein